MKSRLYVLACFPIFFLFLALAQEPASDLEETVEHVYGPFNLKAQSLQQMPPRMEFTFPEDLWLVGYNTAIVDATGHRLAKELQCHTFLGTSLPLHHTHDEVFGLFSDGYTEGMRLPAGFGIFLRAGEKVFWTPMFNNRNSAQTAASVKVTVTIIRAKNLQHPLKTLATTFRTVQFPDLYSVPPGRDVRETTFHLPFTGKIHAIGTHIHPYGVSIELINLTRNRTVWKAVGSEDTKGNLAYMPVYTDAAGYPVREDDSFKLVAVYNNTTAAPVDAMAGMFFLYAPDEQRKTTQPGSQR